MTDEQTEKSFLKREYKKKNGEIKVYLNDKAKYNFKEYNKNSYINNKDKILNSFYICSACNKKILYSNKSNHLKTTKHKLLNSIEELKENKV
jgi:hypothetical protein